jgi:hypothetical protein
VLRGQDWQGNKTNKRKAVKTMKKQIAQLLMDMGIQPHFKGYKYLACAIANILNHPGTYQ